MPSVVKNTSYLTLALILQKIISLTYFTIFARALGPADLGKFYFAISVTSIFSIFIDFGLGNVVTREIAKFPDKAKSILGSTIAVKLPMALLTALAIFGWALAWGYDPLTKQLIYISSIVIVLDSFTGIFYAVIRGFHNLKFESLSSILFQLIILVLSLIVIKNQGSIQWLMLTMVAASLFNFVYSLVIVKGVWKLSTKPLWDKQIIKKLFAIALPFGVYVIVQRFYTFFDSVLLFKLAGDRAVGLYQVPFKIIIALQFLPSALVASLYPALSSYWHKNKEKLILIFEQAIIYCLIIAIPVSFGAIAMADKIILLFKEGFAETGLLLKVSMLAVPFMFLGFPVGSLLNACDKQKRNTINMAITALVSAGLNIILIPRLGVLGACVTTLITSILMLILGWVVIPKITHLHWPTIILALGRIVLVGLVMALLVNLLKDKLNPVLTIFIGATSYFILLYAVGGIKSKDIKLFISSLKNKDKVVID